MKNLVLEEFDLHEFNKWILDIQKLEQKINCVLNIFGVWHIKITLNELFKDPDVICNKYLSKEAISKRVFRENKVKENDFDNPDYNDCISAIDSMLIPAEFLRKSIYLIHEKIKLENFEPEELFEMENGVVSISKRAEHSYFIRHAKYLGKGEKALSILYDICDSLKELAKHDIHILHTLQNLFVPKDEKFEVNIETFKQFIKDSEAYDSIQF